MLSSNILQKNDSNICLILSYLLKGRIRQIFCSFLEDMRTMQFVFEIFWPLPISRGHVIDYFICLIPKLRNGGITDNTNSSILHFKSIEMSQLKIYERLSMKIWWTLHSIPESLLWPSTQLINFNLKKFILVHDMGIHTSIMLHINTSEMSRTDAASWSQFLRAHLGIGCLSSSYANH